MAEEIKKLTPTGRIQRPAYSLVAEWVKTSWDNIDPMLIQRSFKCCGISNSRDGSEDKYIFDYDWMNRKRKSGGNLVYLDNDIENGSDEISDIENGSDEINDNNDEISENNGEDEEVYEISDNNGEDNEVYEINDNGGEGNEVYENDNEEDSENNNNNDNNNSNDNSDNNNRDDDDYYQDEIIDYENLWGDL